MATTSAHRAVIFDWGGVLMRTQSRNLRFMWDMVLGQARGTLEALILESDTWQNAQRGLISLKDYWQAIGDELGLDESAVAQLRQDFYLNDTLDFQLIDLIRVLRKQEVMVGLLSNNSADLLTELQHMDLLQLFDACIISAEIGVLKPEAAAYQAMLTALDVPAEESLMIDDFAHNIAGAREVGMAGILFRPGDDLQLIINSWLGDTRFAAELRVR